MTHGRRIGRFTSGAVATVATVALVVAACGSTPTVAAFNSQANSICQTYRPKLKDVYAAIALSNRSQSQLEAMVSPALFQAKQGSTQLQALAQPSGEGAALRMAFRLENDQLQEFKNLATALQHGNGAKILSSETLLEKSVASLNQQFDMLGLAECGSGSSPSPTGAG